MARLATIAISAILCVASAVHAGNLIPRPQRTLSRTEFVAIDYSSFGVDAPDNADGAMTLAKQMLEEKAAKLAASSKKAGGHKLVVSLAVKDDDELPEEGYRIRVTKGQGHIAVTGVGRTSLGAFYAAMTLLQLITVENGITGIRVANIDDWPHWQTRYFSDYALYTKGFYTGLARWKINGFALQHRREWRDFALDKPSGYWKLPTYKEALEESKSFKEQTGLISFMLVLNIYAERNQRIFNMTDENDVKDLADRCKLAASYGFDHVMIATDDWTPYESGRYVLPYKDEREKFGDSAGKATGYLMRWLHDLVKPECPNLQLSICPAVYSLYDHKATGPDGRRYLRDLAEETPKDVAIVWTGPHIVSSAVSKEDYRVFSELTNNHKQFLWDNSECINSPIADQPVSLYKGFADDSRGTIFINTRSSYELDELFNLMTSDHLWNPYVFNRDKSLRSASDALYGSAVYPVLKTYLSQNRKLDSVKGDRVAELKLITDMLRSVDKLTALGFPAGKLRNGLEARQTLLKVKVPEMNVPRFRSVPVLDGKFDDSCWAEAAKFSLKSMMKLDSAEGSIGCDGRNLYLAFTVHHSRLLATPPAKPHDDPIYSMSDAIEIFLLPPHEDDYWHLVLDHMGNRFDELNCEGPDSLNPDWKVATAKADGVWTAEVSIPLNIKDAPLPVKGSVWRANFCRETAGTDETSAWSSATGNPGFHQKDIFGILKFQ